MGASSRKCRGEGSVISGLVSRNARYLKEAVDAIYMECTFIVDAKVD